MNLASRGRLTRSAIVVAALASAARAVFLLARPLWHDELFTLWAARQPPAVLCHLLRSDSGPPLFYLLEKPFLLLAEAFGYDPIARLLPYFAILLLFFGARSLEQTPARFDFVALLAFSPLLLVYSAEARAYGLLAAANFALFVLLFRARPTKARLVLSTLLVACSLWIHYLALFFVAAAVIVLAARRRWPQVLALAGGLLLFVPWIPVLLSQPLEATAWMREPVGRSLFDLSSGFGGAGRIPGPLGGPLPAVLVGSGAFIGVALLAVLAAATRRDDSLRDPLALIVLTAVLVVAASLKRPVAFAGRTEMVVLPVWYWALARAGSENRAARGTVRAGFACALAASACILAARKDVPEPAQAVAFIQSIAQKEDLVVAGAAFYLPARLAHDRGELTAPVLALPEDISGHPGWFLQESPAESDYQAIEADLASLPPGRRAFVLLHPIFRTARLSALLSARGIVRVMSERPQTVVLVCTVR
jgi:hypothetical protein